MKIAIFHNLPPGGAKRTIFRQTEFLSKKHQLYLFKLASTQEDFFDLRPLSQKVYSFPFKLKLKTFQPWQRVAKDYHNFITLAQVHRQMAQVIDSHQFDVCLVHPDKHTQAPFLLKYLKTPTLYYCHEVLRLAYEPQLGIPDNLSLPKKLYELTTRKIRKVIDRQNAHQANLILVNSLHTKKNVFKAYHKSARLCYPGVNSQIFKPAEVKKENQLLFIAAKSSLTGYDLAIKALQLIPQKIRPRLKSITQFKLTDKKLAKLYSQSLACLCLSYNEPFGSIPLESMACQTPVIAFNQGGYKETVVNNKTGYLLPRKPQALANKIVYLIKHPESVKRIGRQARQHVQKNFTWRVHNQLLEKQLKKLAS